MTWAPDPELINRLHPSLREYAVAMPPDDVEMTPEQINALFPNLQKVWQRHLRHMAHLEMDAQIQSSA